MAFVVVSATAVVDQDHTLGSDDLSNQDYKCWSKDYIAVVEA